MSLICLPYHEINLRKWDECIELSPNGLIYSTEKYLSGMCETWHGLVLNDYESVMPLCARKKYGIRYLYQPAFIQQQGIISQTAVTGELVKLFLKKVFSLYRYGNITLNFKNPTPEIEGAKFNLRNNYLVELNGAANKWEESGYLSKRFRRAQKNNLLFKVSSDIDGAVQRYMELYGKRLPYFRKEDYTAFISICKYLNKEGRVIIRQVWKDEHLVGEVLLLKHKQRLYNIISSVNEAGRKMLANYFLYGCIINEFDGTGMVLDLEGSDHKGIGFFYEKMSDYNQVYPAVHFNKLPFPLSWAKG